MWKCVAGAPGAPVYGGEPVGGLVGRETESAALWDLLAGHHLVTVTGRAGVGKSRLAATAARRANGPWRRVVHVRWQGSELVSGPGNGPAGPLPRPGNGPGAAGASGAYDGPDAPGALAAAVHRALTGRRPRPGEAGTAGLARLLPSVGGLLFLDDVDPVQHECMGLVQRLLVAVPGLRVLVTSRRALGLGEEQVLVVPPLTTSAPEDGNGHAAAVELFLRRARAVVEGFRPGAEGVRAVEAICRSLEGVPHAIELAAEQVARQPVAELADVLERHQCWLRSERPLLRRHRSLRDTVGASYALSEREARIVWGRASALAGAFDESTAVFLCAGGTVEPHAVPSLLARLAAIHVLEPVREPGGPRPPRYRMTRAAQDFGHERLREAGELEAALERRASRCRQLTAVAQHLWTSGCESQAVRLVHEEQEEITALLRVAVHRAVHAETALETVTGLWFWWVVHGHAREGLDLLTRLLPLCPTDSAATAPGRWLAAWLIADRDPLAARVLLGRAWPGAVLAGDDATLGHIAHVHGVIALREGDARTAAEQFAQAAALIPPHTPNGPSAAVSLAAQALAEASFAPGAARRSAHRALAGPGLRGDAWATLTARYVQALLDHRSGRGVRARTRALRALGAVDRDLTAPHGHAALLALVAEIEVRSAEIGT